MSDFFEKFKSDIQNFKSKFAKMHAGLASLGLTSSVLGFLGYFLLKGISTGAGVTGEIFCLTAGCVCSALTALVGFNGIKNYKKLKKLEKVDESNIMSLANEFCRDENKNIQKFATVLQEKIISDDAAKRAAINPFEGEFHQQQIPQEYFDRPVEKASEDANETPIDVDII